MHRPTWFVSWQGENHDLTRSVLLHYNRFTALWILFRTTRVSQYHKGKTKTNLDFLEQETVSGSGISWVICKSAARPRQITMPAPHHSFFTGRMPFSRRTNSVKALKAQHNECTNLLYAKRRQNRV